MESKKTKLEQIAKEISRCALCRRGKVGKPVPGEGNPNARIVFIGEAPGKEEAKTGRPFVGRAGKLLRSLIKTAGLSEKEVYITNPVKRLPKYGTPKKSDIIHGRAHLQKQIAVINPKLIVLLGRVAAAAFFDETISVTKMRGRIISKDGARYFVTLHPSAALRFQKFKRMLVSDFKKIKTALNKVRQAPLEVVRMLVP